MKTELFLTTRKKAALFIVDDEIVDLLIAALELKDQADTLWPPFNSLHEAYGVLMEEIREFETEVFLKQSKRNPGNIRSELIDIIAVCMRATQVNVTK